MAYADMTLDTSCNGVRREIAYECRRMTVSIGK